MDYGKIKSTIFYARLGLMSLTAAIVPITSIAQDICGTSLFESEPDAANLMNQAIELLDVLEDNGVVAFQGIGVPMSIVAVRGAMRDGVSSATLLACVVNAESIEFSVDGTNRVVYCPPPFGGSSSAADSMAGQLFCTNEVAALSKFLGSEG